MGALLMAVAIALFFPIPLSGFIPATALLVTSIGIVERDGVVALAGLALGAVAVVVTLVIGMMIVAGAKALVLH